MKEMQHTLPLQARSSPKLYVVPTARKLLKPLSTISLFKETIFIQVTCSNSWSTVLQRNKS